MLRYDEKIDFVLEKISSLPDNLEEPFMKDALYYRLQTSIEATTDIASMLCKDLGKNVSDDYSNIECLRKMDVISEQMAGRLKKINGLRNILVHKYNGLREDIILDNQEIIIETLEDFVENVEKILSKIFK